MRSLLVGFSLLHSFLFFSCATDKAGELREARPVTVGFLGAAYRPNAKLGFSVTGSFSNDGNSGNFGTIVDSVERNVRSKGHHVEGAALFFPWESTAFHFGLGLRRGTGTVRFDADKTNSADSTVVEYQRTSTFITFPIGWFWIWNNGFTLAIDLGPNFRVVNSTDVTSDGGSDVDTSDRDDFISTHEGRLAVGFGGRGIIGYSF